MTSVTYYPGYNQIQVSQNLLVQDIQSISNTNPTVVFTVNNNNYVAGMIVSFLIPEMFGMVELNALSSQVLFAADDMFVVDIDSTQFTPFAYPSTLPLAYTPPSAIPSSSGPYLSPLPLPYANQDSFEGVIYNNGAF